MSLKPAAFNNIPADTLRVARAAFPKGNIYLKVRDELGPQRNQACKNRVDDCPAAIDNMTRVNECRAIFCVRALSPFHD